MPSFAVLSYYKMLGGKAMVMGYGCSAQQGKVVGERDIKSQYQVRGNNQTQISIS